MSLLRSLPLPLPRLRLALLLALVLVVAQQVGAVHRLGHALERLSGLAQEDVCCTCLALAATDTPLVDATGAAAADVPRVAVHAPERADAADLGGASCAYRSRAPPEQA